MKPFALIVAVLLCLFVRERADAGPVAKCVKGAAKAVKVVRVAKAPLRFAGKVLPPYGRK